MEDIILFIIIRDVLYIDILSIVLSPKIPDYEKLRFWYFYIENFRGNNCPPIYSYVYNMFTFILIFYLTMQCVAWVYYHLIVRLK